MNIGILFGGKSEEHEVSCLSAYSIYHNIDQSRFTPIMIGITKNGKFRYYNEDLEHLLDGDWENYASNLVVDILGNDGPVAVYGEETIPIDCIFPVLHGPYGEDGRIQGILDFANIPYVGCGVLSSAICMDKAITKDLLRLNHIPQTKYVIYHKGEKLSTFLQKLEGFIYPLFVKPANLGSSVGIVKVKKRGELEAAIQFAQKFDKKIIVEQGVNGREIECSVLQDDTGIYVSTPGELVVHDEFYDYDTKYKKNTTEVFIPALLEKETIKTIQNIAQSVFELLDCRGISRVDFFVDKNSEEVLLNEINTLPGFTSISMYPKLLDFDGISYSQLISRLIDSALNNYA